MAKERRERKEIGQFFTGKELAEYMASLYTDSQQTLTVIDAGAGSGVLSKAFVEKCIHTAKVYLIAFENDEEIIPELQKTLSCLQERFPDFEYEIRTENYVLATHVPDADFIISNPPYLKIKASADERTAIANVCPVTNLYAAFMVKSVLGLKDGGEMVYLVPRSWTSGFYFSAFRVFLSQNGAITRLTLFKDRRNIFCTENILQDAVIIQFKRGARQSSISLCCAKDGRGLIDETIFVPEQFLYWGKNKSLILPSTEKDKEAILRLLSNKSTFEGVGREIKTGGVVQFRATDRITQKREYGMIPLLSTDYVFRKNLSGLKFIHPKTPEKVRNQWYVLLSRIAPKEDGGKIQLAIYDPAQFEDEWIALDLNVCYVPCDSRDDAEDVIRYFHSNSFVCLHRAIQSGNQLSVRTIMELPWSSDAAS